MKVESPYTDEDRARWRQVMLAKGKEISDKLAAVLAGKDIRLMDISLYKNDEPAEKKEVRLRRYLDHVMARMRVLDHPRFGYDPAAGAFLSVAELNEKPWAESDPS